MKNVILLLSLVMLFTACEKDLGPNVKGVRVNVETDSITIINGTDDELRFFPVNQNVLAALNWAPYCLDSGLIISANERETILFSDIYGYQKNCTLVVHWWTCREVDGTLEPGEVQSTVVSTAQ